MKFGILVLTYNRPELICLTLQSLASQTYRDFSVLLIDNGTRPPLDQRWSRWLSQGPVDLS